MTRSAFAMFCTALLLTACQGGEKPANDATEVNSSVGADTAVDEKAIRGQIDRWHQLIKARDAKSISELYADDGAVMPPNTPIGKGRAAIQQTWASMMQAPGFDLAITPEQIDVSSAGDMALDRGTYKLTVTPGGTAKIDTGKYVVVWRKIGSEWKAAADIFNSDLPAG